MIYTHEEKKARDAYDDAMRRVRAVLTHFGVADCDDPIAALEEVPARADAVVDDEVAHANELALQVAALRAEVDMLRGVGCDEVDGGEERGPCGACLKCARRERDEARAIIEGRTTPPTNSEIVLFRGAWLFRHPDGTFCCVAKTAALLLAAEHRTRPFERDEAPGHWWALDATGRPCAWPSVSQEPAR